MNMQTHHEDILFSELRGAHGTLGVITLNRPKSLNALNYDMTTRLKNQLKRWEHQDTIKAIIIRSNDERAFCAGGDIKHLYFAHKTGQLDLLSFFRDEYQLNRYIYCYSKPYISFLHGIAMGGGLGISLHGSHRIGTETLKLAMPETAIGFFPDIGSSYFLPRCPHEVGIFLGVTGYRIDAARALKWGLIDNVISAHKLDDVMIALQESKWKEGSSHHTVTHILNQFAQTIERETNDGLEDIIKKHFTHKTMTAIINSLQVDQSNELIPAILQLLQKASPTSLKVTLRELQQAKQLNFDQCIQIEYRLAARFLQGHDLFEGIRALLIEKDQNPQWQPTHIDEIDDKIVESYFAPIQPELDFI